MSSPAVSVVMAVYNGEPFLVQAIESVLRQTITDFDLIVVDDASTDNTPRILQAFKERDSRVVVLRHEERQERSKSRNQAILAARGKYIAIMDADDLSMPQRLERQLQYMEAFEDVALLGTWGYEIDADNEIVGIWSPPVEDTALRKAMLNGNPFCHSSVMFRKAALDTTGLYDESLNSSEDYDLHWRLTRRYRCANIPDCLVLKRVDWERELQVHRLRRSKTLQVRLKWFRQEGVGLAQYMRLVMPLAALWLPPRLMVSLRRLKRRLHPVPLPPNVAKWLDEMNSLGTVSRK